MTGILQWNKNIPTVYLLTFSATLLEHTADLIKAGFIPLDDRERHSNQNLG